MMIGAHLEYVGPYHWRLTGTETIDIRRVEELQPDLSIVNRWLVEPHNCERAGGPGSWSTAAHALAHAFGLATGHGSDAGGPVGPILEAIKQGRIAAGAAP